MRRVRGGDKITHRKNVKDRIRRGVMKCKLYICYGCCTQELTEAVIKYIRTVPYPDSSMTPSWNKERLLRPILSYKQMATVPFVYKYG